MPGRHAFHNLSIGSLALAGWLAGCQDPSAPQVESLRAVSSASQCPRALLSSYLPAATLWAGRETTTGAQSASVTRVHGGGSAIVTDENGNRYTANVGLSAVLDPNGGTHGSVNFDFDPTFSEVWGAEPGIHSIHAVGQVTGMAAGGGGVILSGTLTETDVAPGRRPLFFENEPFEVVISGPGRFRLQWCALPPFDFELTTGSLDY
jgi:hypothetical protein